MIYWSCLERLACHEKKLMKKPLSCAMSPWNLNVLPHHLPKWPKYIYGKVSTFFPKD